MCVCVYMNTCMYLQLCAMHNEQTSECKQKNELDNINHR